MSPPTPEDERPCPYHCAREQIGPFERDAGRRPRLASDDQIGRSPDLIPDEHHELQEEDGGPCPLQGRTFAQRALHLRRDLGRRPGPIRLHPGRGLIGCDPHPALELGLADLLLEVRLPEAISTLLLRGNSRLKALRLWREMSQTELADKAGIGQGYLSDLESGRRAGSAEVLRNLASCLAVPLEWIDA